MPRAGERRLYGFAGSLPATSTGRRGQMGKNVLIIGEDPNQIDFDAPDAPNDMTAEKVMDGLNASVARLEAGGHAGTILLTLDEDSVAEQVTRVLSDARYDVIVIGAGLRTLPAMALQFERLINTLRDVAPKAKLAFNSQPDDSDEAAGRWL
jgi:hypothetical protein